MTNFKITAYLQPTVVKDEPTMSFVYSGFNSPDDAIEYCNNLIALYPNISLEVTAS